MNEDPYSTRHRAPTELAQSGAKTTRMPLDLATLEVVHEIPYPYSTAPSGVTVENQRYWFGEIAKANSEYDIGTRS